METSIRIAAVILASGISKRMGATKQLLPLNGVPLLEFIIRKLLPFPFEKIHAVIGNQFEEITNQIQIEDPRFDWIINDRFTEGQSTALKQAVQSVKDLDGMMVFLADQPLIQEETIKLIFDHVERPFVQQEKFVVQPSFMEKQGHPVFFSHSLFPHFEMLEGDEGGKRVIYLAQKHYRIPVNDAGILFDIDTPEDYQKLLEFS